MNQFEKIFAIDDVNFAVSINVAGFIDFYRIEKTVNDRLEYDEEWLQITDKNSKKINTVRLFNKIMAIIEEHISLEKPHSLLISANSAAKSRIYKKLADNIYRNIEDRYNKYEIDDNLCFYKKSH